MDEKLMIQSMSIKTKSRIGRGLITATLCFSLPVNAATYIVGQDQDPSPKTGVIVGAPIGDGQPVWRREMLRTAAVHEGDSGLRMLVRYNWTGGWDSTQPSDGGTKGSLYCTTGNDNTLNLTHSYGPPYGTTPDGHAMWKTNIDGLYFAMELNGFFIPMADNIRPTGSVWLDGSANGIEISGTPQAASNCGKASNDSKFVLQGGVQFGAYVYLYVDDKFTPLSKIENFRLRNSANYDFQVTNPTTSQGGGHSIFYRIDPYGFHMQWPTCNARTVSVSGKQVSAVNLGNHYPKAIKDGLTPVPFDINLSGCTYVNNIEIKLSSNDVGVQDKTLLGNNSTDNPASGVGVRIEGLQNDRSNQMVLPPDGVTIYKDTNHNDGTAAGDIGDGSDPGSSTKTLKFQATLKQDGNQTITPGNVKATGKFTITYP